MNSVQLAYSMHINSVQYLAILCVHRSHFRAVDDMARRSDHSRDEIRAMALAAAEVIIDEQGYATLSARKVASSIGYTVGTLYLVFRNLDDLVLQVNGRTLDALFARLTEALAHSHSERLGVTALGQGYLGFAMAHPHRWGAVFEHQLPTDVPTPDWYLAKVAQSFELVEAELTRLAPARSETQIAQAARALWSGVHGVCILGLTGRLGNVASDSLEALVESLISNYLAGFTSGTVFR